jgi:TatA/E family protein of Tat protein translocase
MFGMGMPEILLILAIALIVIGPKKLPDLAKSMGRAMREFKKATSELKESLEIDSELGDVKKTFSDMNQDIKESVDLAGSYNKAAPAEKPPAPGGADSETTPPSGEAAGGPATDSGPAPEEGSKKDG